MMARSQAMILALLMAVGPTTGAVFATDWQNAGKTAPEALYPYDDLPGVKAQADLKDEDQYNCHTETRLVRRLQTETFRPSGLPQVVYVCERDGVKSVGDKVPLKGHYQPVR